MNQEYFKLNQSHNTEDAKTIVTDKLLEEEWDQKRFEFKALQDMTPQEIKDLRQNQSVAERLAEYITGIRLDDPKFFDRLVQDQKIIRQKYNLPNIELLLNDSPEYERILRSAANKLGTSIRTEAEIGQFFTAHPHAVGVYLSDQNWIALNINDYDVRSYRRSLMVLEHELIHAYQHERYPSMPIEAMEYEAYISNANFIHLSTLDPTDKLESLDVLFGMMIGGSVNFWYEVEAEKQGFNKNPKWKQIDYFLPDDNTVTTEDFKIMNYR